MNNLIFLLELYFIGMAVYLFLKQTWSGFKESSLNTDFTFKEIIFYPIHTIQWLGYIVGVILILIFGRFL